MHRGRPWEYFEDFVTRSTFHSNAIEGNTLTLPETYAILWNDNSIEVRVTARELYEAINLKRALTSAMKDREPELRETLIERISTQIGRNISELDDYRRVQVMIRGAEHMPPPPALVRQMMMELVYDYNNDVRSGREPLAREADFHIRFERSHPFEDGNGRTGRVLLERGMLLSGLASAAITRGRRADYLVLLADLTLLAERDVDGLAALLAELSRLEERRIEAFRAAAQPRG